MAVKRFIFFHNVRHPVEMAEREINAFLTHLAVTRALEMHRDHASCVILLRVGY